MQNRKNNEEVAEMYELYLQGYSLADVAKTYGRTRQSVWSVFKTRGYPLRKKKFLPFVIYDGLKFAAGSYGYLRQTDSRKTHVSLHRYVWEKERGTIPEGYDVHHLNGDRADNRIENLECLPKAEHTRLYSPSCNQHSHKCYDHARKGKM